MGARFMRVRAMRPRACAAGLALIVALCAAPAQAEREPPPLPKPAERAENAAELLGGPFGACAHMARVAASDPPLSDAGMLEVLTLAGYRRCLDLIEPLLRPLVGAPE